MADIVELTDQLNALRKARAAGTQEVQTADGRRLVYKSDAQMAAAANDLERQITLASGVPIATVLVSSTKGLCDA
jgi:hypothetical protein